MVALYSLPKDVNEWTCFLLDRIFPGRVCIHFHTQNNLSILCPTPSILQQHAWWYTCTPFYISKTHHTYVQYSMLLCRSLVHRRSEQTYLIIEYLNKSESIELCQKYWPQFHRQFSFGRKKRSSYAIGSRNKHRSPTHVSCVYSHMPKFHHGFLMVQRPFK